MEPPPGIGLGRPVQRMLQGTDRITGTPGRSLRGGTSRNGTHRAPPDRHCAPTKQRPFPHRRLCCPPGSTGTTAASDAHPASNPLPEVIGYRTPRSGSTIRRPPGRGGPPQFPPPPSIRSAPHTPGSPSRLRFQALHRFHGLHPEFGGSALPAPARRGVTLTTPQASRHATDRIVAPPYRALDAGLRPGPFPTEPPACYRASWQLPGPDFHRQATTSLRTARSALRHGVTSRSAGRTKKPHWMRWWDRVHCRHVVKGFPLHPHIPVGLDVRAGCVRTVGFTRAVGTGGMGCCALDLSAASLGPLALHAWWSGPHDEIAALRGGGT